MSTLEQEAQKVFADAKKCKHQDDSCDCPLVVYENEDGRCRHKACEGPMNDCGDIVEIA
jgi:thymidylate synthase ThyX